MRNSMTTEEMIIVCEDLIKNKDISNEWLTENDTNLIEHFKYLVRGKIFDTGEDGIPGCPLCLLYHGYYFSETYKDADDPLVGDNNCSKCPYSKMAIYPNKEKEVPCIQIKDRLKKESKTQSDYEYISLRKKDYQQMLEILYIIEEKL